MARKSSSGAGIALIGCLFVLYLLLKYWQIFLPIGVVIIVGWIIVKSPKKQPDSKIAPSKSRGYHPSSTSRYQSSGNNVPVVRNNNMQSGSGLKDFWIPSGKTIQCAGYTIQGGLIYFGVGLKSIRGWNEEPSLINPNLPCDRANPDREGQHMGYWPSYSQMHPTSRAAFLEWLSDGRITPKINIGYVFIYFYGLERRVFVDAKISDEARHEIPDIIAEVKRLLSLYGDNSSFHGYASRFLDILQVSQTISSSYLPSPQIRFFSTEAPLMLKVTLGQLAKDGVPLPSQWALAWAENDQSMPQRTATKRCSEEFRELFKFRYHEKFGEGMVMKPNKTLIRATYHPASPSFDGQVEIPMPSLPDLTAITGPSSKIRELVSVCGEELEGYSRYLGRNPDEKNSIEALSYLPLPILKNRIGKDFQKLTVWLEEKLSTDIPVSAPFSSLLDQIPSFNRDNLGKKDAVVLCNFLGKMNIGLEADPRFGNFTPNPNQDIILFKITDNAPCSPSSEYSAAIVILHLACAVACVDESVDPSEESYLEDQLKTWLQLTPYEKVRLSAHKQWLLASFPSMNGLKKRVELLKQPQRESLGRFLVGIAQADSYINPSEMKILKKIFEMLDLDVQTLYSHAHEAAIEPVTVQTQDLLMTQGHSIPHPSAKFVNGLSLNASSIEKKLAETNAVSAILNNIFIDEDHELPKAQFTEVTSADMPIPGIDLESFKFMRLLCSKAFWRREELEKLASDNCIMLDGTLDCINDVSFDHFGGPFFEDNDPIEINMEYAKEITK